MDRRQFLTLSPTRHKTAKAPFGRTDSGIAPFTGAFDTAQAVHLLKRALFGASPADLSWAKGLGSMDQAVDALLTPLATMPSPPVNNYGDDATGIAPGATWVNAPAYVRMENDPLGQNRQRSYKAWWTGVMLNQTRSIHEKMVLFWHNHFVTETQTVTDLRYVYKYNTTLRQYALGNFKALTKAITKDPAMLIYLNGNLNGKTAADENYARELHELFTIGKGPDSHYTEDDVRASARVLTGYRVDENTITSHFDSTQHDFTNKQFSDFYGAKTVTGKTGPAGETELDDLLNIIFSQPECAKFIVRKLYRFFIYYKIDDAVEQNVIAPLADIFRTNNYEILPVLSALFKSEHFYDPLNMSCLIKSPIDFCIGLCREFSVVFPAASDYMNAYEAWDYIRDFAGKMLQNIGDPPLVAGWAPYYQEPMFHEMWINTDTLPKRNMLSDYLVQGQGAPHDLKIDVLAFADQLSDPGNPVTLVKDSLDLLYRVDVSDSLRSFMKNSILLSGQSPNSDYYWTDAWQAYKGNPGDAATRTVVESRLKAMYKFIMDLSEYQLS
ncbi:DUF1800 family protein [Chitinophaga sp. GbtcB8]|uniref:DUF1800 domain-containing protein n=1 Tax=Chitinophaga sp. GbtcB8 TaxID=2824753 RepID=UPI001C3001EA|nr:DUF1800 domain-containing protein [Chitinophaga sp. GbtcB8]